MKKVFGIAALLLALAACNKVETEITPVEQPSDSKGITITATLAPKTAVTKAVADNGDNKITVTWAENEHIAILYDKDGAQVADATITAVDGTTGAATISFTVVSGTPDNTACTLVYPYSAAKDDKSGVKDAATLLSAQDGTLNANLDVRVGAGTIQTTTPSLTVTTQPEAQFAIFKFTLSGPSIDATHPLVIKDNASNKTITTVTPASTATSVFVAMPAAASTTYKFVVITADNKYIKSGTATIAAGNYYQTTLTMSPRYPLALSSATAEWDLGAVACEDGYLYMEKKAAPSGKTALGIVGKGYGIVQNTKAFDFMDFIKEVSGNEPNIETFGALGNGERMFITATLGKDCFLNPNDAIKNYVVFTNSHDGTGGVMAFFTPIRIICQNTLNMAIRGCANKVVFKHTSKVEERLDWTIERNRKIAAELFSKSVKFSDKFMDNMLHLKEQRVTSEDVRDFTAKMYLNDTQFNLLQKANHNLDKVDEISTRTKNLIQQLRDTTEFGVGQEQNRGTKVWLLNGVTTYLQNSKGWLGKEQEQFNSLMFGEGQKKVQRAYDMLMAA